MPRAVSGGHCCSRSLVAGQFSPQPKRSDHQAGESRSAWCRRGRGEDRCRPGAICRIGRRVGELRREDRRSANALRCRLRNASIPRHVRRPALRSLAGRSPGGACAEMGWSARCLRRGCASGYPRHDGSPVMRLAGCAAWIAGDAVVRGAGRRCGTADHAEGGRWGWAGVSQYERLEKPFWEQRITESLARPHPCGRSARSTAAGCPDRRCCS